MLNADPSIGFYDSRITLDSKSCTAQCLIQTAGQIQVQINRQRIRFCTASDGASIAYAATGQGPPLLKAPSWFSHLQHDWQSVVWKHWHEEFARQHTYYRYDRRGCGLSDWDAEQSHAAYCTDMECVVEAAKLNNFILFGAGHGGPVAVAYAAKHPEKVTKLVLYGTYARGRAHRKPCDQRDNEIDINLRLASLGWGANDPSFRQFFAAQFLPDASAEQLRAFTELQRLSTSTEAAVRHLEAVFDVDVCKLAPLIKCPTLVLHVRGDLRNPFDEGRLLASMIPEAQFVPLEGRTHFLQESDPAWPQLVGEIRAFLANHSPALISDATLTHREEEVLDHVSRGLDNLRIAAQLGVSEKTVRNHITRIFAKLGVSTRAQAIVTAREAGYPRANGQDRRPI
jgi:pimeloyl-ACP methyl ester carboxylesterase/DNA-binding CsgD family transcriptional regulator